MNKKSQFQAESEKALSNLRKENADEHLAKSKIAARILQIVQSRRLKQVEAGKLLGLPQPKVSALLSGRVDGFSTDRLFRLLTKLGCDIQIKLSTPRPRSQGRVRVTVGQMRMRSLIR